MDQQDYKREWRWRKQGHENASIARYNELLARQDGKCAICGQPKRKKALVYDDRGLICTACHVHLSWLERHFEIVLYYFEPGT